ncbi:secoisolariciresinol dehydrogenase-like protein, partial [Tanacetum coccineum]
MDSSTSSQANQPCSPLNHVTLDIDFDQLMNRQEYYQTQDYSMGHGSAHGSGHSSAPVDDDDDFLVEEMSPDKAKKPQNVLQRPRRMISRRRSRQKTVQRRKRSRCAKLGAITTVRVHDFTLEHCYNIMKDHQGWIDIKMLSFYKNTKGRKKSKTSETTSGSASGGFNLNNEAGEFEEQAQEDRPMGRDRSKAKKKSPASSREGSSSFVDLVADKYLGIKSTKEKMQEQQDSYIQLKNRELDIQEAARKEAAELTMKVAMITGGAQGIGETTARLFVKHGAKVVIADIQDELGQHVCEDIGLDNALFVHCDVTIESDVENAINTTLAKYGKLDIMINNAAIVDDASQAMIPARSGNIIMMGSVSGCVGGIVSHSYSCSKHAIVGLTKNTAAELGQYGIRVNCLSPYFIPSSPLTANLVNDHPEKYSNVYSNLKGIALVEDDVAEAALFLASDEA